MEGKLWQPVMALFQYVKLILTEEETTSGYGCGFLSAVFSRPASVCPCDSAARGFLYHGKVRSVIQKCSARMAEISVSTLICSFDGLHDNNVLRCCADFGAHTLHMDTQTEAGEKISVHFTGLLESGETDIESVQATLDEAVRSINDRIPIDTEEAIREREW